MTNGRIVQLPPHFLMLSLKAAGVNVVVLLALSDDGAPSFDRRVAEQLAALATPSFACTPARLPELMAAAI